MTDDLLAQQKLLKAGGTQQRGSETSAAPSSRTLRLAPCGISADRSPEIEQWDDLVLRAQTLAEIFVEPS
jgi:hypothetical protein